MIQRDIVYKPENGEMGLGDWFLPEGEPPKGGFPMVLCIHGGGWSGLSRPATEGVSLQYQRAGFAVFNIEYRLAGHQGVWPQLLEDCLDAARFMLASDLPVRHDRLGVFGGSAGGHLALMTGLTLSREQVSHIVCLSGVANLPPYQNASPRTFVTLFGHEPSPEELASAEPIRLLRKDCPPILCTQWLRDNVVPVECCYNFVAAARKLGAPVSEYIYDDDREVLWVGPKQVSHNIWIPDLEPHFLHPDLEGIIMGFAKLHP
ncbi:MAG: alpha/beta hydrolase [Victivallales bacterium]|nr:alpha/beta hydrolase [Victivallales bacterium]